MTQEAQTRLFQLFDGVVDGTCSDADREEFSRLVDAHPELAQLVVKQLQTDGLLKWSQSPNSLRLDSRLDSNAPLCDAISRPAKLKRWAIGVAMLAASLACVAAFWWQGNVDAPVVGEMIRPSLAQFSSRSTAIGSENRLTTGLLEVESGSVDIEFINGVRMKLSGPARVNIDSEMFVRLFHGQATADVPRWARGFTIVTTDVEVVDLGTRFGVVKLEDVKTDVVVFEGEVDLKSLVSADKQFARRLTQGEAARINRLGEIERIFQVHGEFSDNDWSTLRRMNNPGVIAAVWDNLGATKSVSYYQVIFGGMNEDMPAYVDHPHEWNGQYSDGLPKFLVGADYVRTVNDYRYMNYLSIHVEFAADANLYVLFDNRVAVPEWLSTQFIDTGEDIGLDEDAWDGNPTFTLASGAGQSIDNHFSIWRRACAAGETLTLGSMGIGREARAMYGVAATPR